MWLCTTLIMYYNTLLRICREYCSFIPLHYYVLQFFMWFRVFSRVSFFSLSNNIHSSSINCGETHKWLVVVRCSLAIQQLLITNTHPQLVYKSFRISTIYSMDVSDFILFFLGIKPIFQPWIIITWSDFLCDYFSLSWVFIYLLNYYFVLL